jgi:hypothetical protein
MADKLDEGVDLRLIHRCLMGNLCELKILS